MELEFKINIQNRTMMSLLIPVGFFISICPINVLGQHYQDEEKKIKYLNFSFHGNKVYNNRQIRELLNLPKSVKNSNQNDNLGQTKIKFEKKDLLISERKEFGFLITNKIIKKENKGNLVANSKTVIEKNIYQDYLQLLVRNQLQ